MDKQEFWLRLLMVKGIGQKRLNCFARQFTSLASFDAIADYTVEHLAVLQLTVEQQTAFHFPPADYLYKGLAWLTQLENKMVLLGEPDYPDLLQQITQPPAALFIRGNVRVLHQPQLAIVGSRNCSRYGAQWGRYFTQMLSGSGLVITSGLALGIDSIAHRAALEAEGNTVAVLGSGLAEIYPRRHQPLAEDIVREGGCLVSELLPTERPLAMHFPQRNRIISGLSLGVLVVEASVRSGSLITARCGLEQGREVFALPGSLDSEMSAGGHWLIQQGAYLVAQPTDILEQLNSSLQWMPFSLTTEEENGVVFINEPKQFKQKESFNNKEQGHNKEQLSEEEQQKLPFADVLVNVGDDVTPIDVIAEKAGQSVADIAVKLIDLELAGWIEAVPGGYVKMRRAGHV